MASPPYRSPATSPPYPSHTALPSSKKRPALTLNATHSNKRRKPSSFSTSTAGSAHPLRQTSFPPEESALNGARSPSVESDFTGITGGGQSVVTAGTGAKKARGKRKGKEGSVRSGTAKGTADGRSVVGQPGEEADGEEEEEGEGDEGMVEDGGRVDRVAEKKNLAVLVDAFNSDQADRYDMYRRVKLKKETVRKITNQTLSQSVPPSVITTINGFTKVFIGTLVERAREVQQQFADAESSLPSPSPTAGNNAHTDGDRTIDKILDDNDDFADSTKKPKPIGPLLPDHLREALRRYRRDGEGGGAGLAGISLGLGLQGTGAARLGGKRLFR
ncbi:hypothetical protein MMC24_006731 [Lignoscripta atroalba]|nr:hypothetical protein [Lignoscripta atroalba]